MDQSGHAAAIAGQADVIVTRNLRDFPAETLAEYNLAAIHPDLFLRQILDREPALFLAAVHDQQGSLRKPALPMDELLRCSSASACSGQSRNCVG